MTTTDNRKSQRDMSRRGFARIGEAVRFRIKLASKIKPANKTLPRFSKDTS